MSSKASVLMVLLKYHIAGGHETVINNLCIGLHKLGHNVAIGAFSFERNPPDNVRKVDLNKFSLTSSIGDGNINIVHSHQTITNYYSLFTRKPFLFHYLGTANTLKYFLQATFFILRNRISRR